VSAVLWIICDPENVNSWRSPEFTGTRFVEIVDGRGLRHPSTRPHEKCPLSAPPPPNRRYSKGRETGSCANSYLFFCSSPSAFFVSPAAEAARAAEVSAVVAVPWGAVAFAVAALAEGVSEGGMEVVTDFAVATATAATVTAVTTADSDTASVSTVIPTTPTTTIPTPTPATGTAAVMGMVEAVTGMAAAIPMEQPTSLSDRTASSAMADGTVSVVDSELVWVTEPWL
jgi:hypothetical protein